MSDSLWPHRHPWNSLGQNTGVGSLSLLQGIFPTQGSNPGLLHSLPAEPQGKPLDELNVKSLSHVQLSVIPWTVAYQAPLPMGLSKQLYWSGLPFPSPGKHFSIFVSIHTSCIMLETWIFWSFFCSIFTELFLMSENSFWINMRRKAEHPFSICLSFYGMWKSFKIHV